MLKTFYLVILLVISAGVCLSQENVVRNGEFDNGRRSWIFKEYNDADMAYEFPNDSLMSGPVSCLLKIQQGGTAEDLLMYQSMSLKEKTLLRD